MATAPEGVTPADAPECEPGAAKASESLEGGDGIDGARRLETAVSSEEGTADDLIETDTGDEQSCDDAGTVRGGHDIASGGGRRADIALVMAA